MRSLAHAVYLFFARMGGLGLFGLGVLDSSFLVMPLGKDLLMVALTARNHAHIWYYCLMAASGSIVGCLIIDVIFRKAGEAGLERHVSPKRLQYVKRKVTNNAVWGLVVACLAPPPFPFTPFIMAASALQYPRRRMLTVIFFARLARYLIIGVLAVAFGTRILRWAESDVVQGFVIGVVVVSIIGSIISVVHWFRGGSKSARLH